MLDSDDRDAMAAYIAAADRYFRELDEPQRLFAKPFVPLQNAGYNVARVGFLLHHLDHRPLHTVLDFGAGMCWLTAVLLQTGCRVVALDVSQRALALGAEALRQTNLPPDVPAPQLLTYDGYRFPLDDGAVDRIACYDALHHVPNKRTVLREMYRVLRSGGRVCFVEPGPGHAASDEARQEAQAFGVLEDEVDAPALCDLALEVGFSSCYIVPLPLPSDNQLAPDTFRQMRAGARRGVLDWTGNDAVIVLSKLPAGVRDSRSPGLLAADIEVVACPETVAAGAVFAADLRVTNTGDTKWLAVTPPAGGPFDYAAAFLTDHASSARNSHRSVAAYRRFLDDHGLAGAVAIGAQLWPVGGGGPIDLDFARGFISADLWPGQTARVTVQMRAPAGGGPYALRFDAVAEQLTWFAPTGSRAEHAYIGIEGAPRTPDSRAPQRLAANLTLVHRAPNGVLEIAVANTGDTIWLAHPLRGGGWVRVGVQALDSAGIVIDREWRRLDLPHDVWPGQRVSMRVDVADAPPAVSSVRIDLVSELRCWFADQHSPPLTVAL